MSVYPVIMCGGSGTRLWPASRADKPKQFIPLVGERSSFQDTVLRVLGIRGASRLVVIAGLRHAALIEAQLAALGVEATLLLEPEARDSAPAIAAAAAWIHAQDPSGLAVIVSSDHHVPDASAFQQAASRALAVAEEGWIVTLGVEPTEPSTAFGYIKPGEQPLAGAIARVVDAFVEKPDQVTAAGYIEAGYLWNSGNFVAAASTLLAELDRHAPEVGAAARSALAQAQSQAERLELGPAFRTAPRISIDYALMEKTNRAAVAPAAFAWSDLGAWDAVKAASACDDLGNAVIGEATLIDSSNCLVRASEGMRVGLAGVRDLAVVVEPDAVLVTHLSSSQSVKRLHDQIAARAAPAPAAAGLQTWAERLEHWLRVSALPLWWSLGADHLAGGFHESLDQEGRTTGAPRRSRVQARQVFVYTLAGAGGWRGPWRAAMNHGLDFLLLRCRRPDGLFRRLVAEDGTVLDDSANLYDQAFALLALASAHGQAPDRTDLAGLALEVLARVRASFGRAVGGFREDGEPAFQSNPLMHLFEAALAWVETGGGEAWAALADELGALACERLIDRGSGAIDEYYTSLWTPAGFGPGRQVWPGHQFEWAWLLDRWANASGADDVSAQVQGLFDAGRAGIDPARSVAVDAMDEALKVTDARARLWPQTERLKAALVMARRSEGARREAMLAEAAQAAEGLWRYLQTPTPGLWRDRLGGDGRFAEEPAPASSLYHIAGAVADLSRFVQGEAAARPAAPSARADAGAPEGVC